MVMHVMDCAWETSIESSRALISTARNLIDRCRHCCWECYRARGANACDWWPAVLALLLSVSCSKHAHI